MATKERKNRFTSDSITVNGRVVYADDASGRRAQKRDEKKKKK